MWTWAENLAFLSLGFHINEMEPPFLIYKDSSLPLNVLPDKCPSLLTFFLLMFIMASVTAVFQLGTSQALLCLPHGIVWKVKCDCVDVLCERLDPLQGAGGRTGQVKEEGWRSVRVQGSCFPRQGLAEAGRRVCFSCPDGLGHMQTRFPSRQTGPARRWPPSHSLGDCHSQLLPAQARGSRRSSPSQFHLPTDPASLGSSSEVSREGHSKAELFLNDVKNNHIGQLTRIKSRN